MAGTPETIQRRFDQVEEELDLFGKKKPGQKTLFAIPEPPKEKRERAKKKVKRLPREAQLDLFTGKAEHAVQPGLFQDFVKKPVKAVKKAPEQFPDRTSAIQGAERWVAVSNTGRVFEAPSAVAKNADEVASLLQSIEKQSREVLYTVTVDKIGNILSLKDIGPARKVQTANYDRLGLCFKVVSVFEYGPTLLHYFLGFSEAKYLPLLFLVPVEFIMRNVTNG